MKNILSISCLGPLLFSLFACKKAENITISAAKPEKNIGSFFGPDNSVNRPQLIHLYRDTVYIVDQSFTRLSGEQLVIDEGTLIKASGAITIKPGGIILANGTPENPI